VYVRVSQTAQKAPPLALSAIFHSHTFLSSVANPLALSAIFRQTKRFSPLATQAQFPKHRRFAIRLPDLPTQRNSQNTPRLVVTCQTCQAPELSRGMLKLQQQQPQPPGGIL
jgi:hypothetical protein